MFRRISLFALLALSAFGSNFSRVRAGELKLEAPLVSHRTVKIDGLDIFYREAGPLDAPAILLLHGFPSSSHMFRNLIPALAKSTASSPRIIPDSARVPLRPLTSSTTHSTSWPKSWKNLRSTWA